MSLISAAMANHIENGSWIRRMFEAGIQLKQQYGENAVCDFSLGNPDLPPPPAVAEGLRKLAAKAHEPFSLGYMPNGGYAWARKQLATHLAAEHQVDLGEGDVLLTCGAAGALNVLFKSVLNPGDEVLALAPYFVEYGFYVDNHGGTFRTVPTTGTFRPDFDALEKALTPKTRALIINSPNNPTGVVYTAEELARLTALLDAASRRNGRPVYLVSDEPYRFLSYDGVLVPSVLPLYAYAVLASSFSKNLSLAGERLGYLALSPAMPEREKLMAALTMANRILGFVNAPALMQRAVAQLQDVAVDSSIYARRLEAFCKVLDGAGISYVRPKGAFYLFPQVPIDDVEFCRLLQEQKILAVPGRGFGMPGYIRLAFCVDERVIAGSAEGFKRAMAKALTK